MSDTPAHGVCGHILWDHHRGCYFFRIYPGGGGYVDYELKVEALHVQILNHNLVLKEGAGGNALGWRGPAPAAPSAKEPHP